jgi:hypothetical protein
LKASLSCEIALEGVAVLHTSDLALELLAQVGQALLFGSAPGGFVRLGEGMLRFRTHWFFLFCRLLQLSCKGSHCESQPARTATRPAVIRGETIGGVRIERER